VLFLKMCLASSSDCCIDNARVIYTKNPCYYPGTFLGINPVSSVSNVLYFLTLPLVSVMRVIYTSKGMSKMFGVRVICRCALSIKNTVFSHHLHVSIKHSHYHQSG
jgi:hypothetical protein